LKAVDCPFTGNTEKTTVVAAKAGIHKALERSLDCRFRGNDEMLMRAVLHLPSVRCVRLIFTSHCAAPWGAANNSRVMRVRLLAAIVNLTC
jgi:hypothetical protein